MFPLDNLTRVSTAAHSMYFPSLFQLGSPLILVTVPGIVSGYCPFFSHCQRRVLGSRSLLIVCFYFYQNFRVVPHGTKGTSPKFVMRPVYLRSQLRNNMNTISVLVLLMHLFHTLYTRYAGITHHWALQTSGRGWADSKAVHGMECSGAHSLYWRSLSAGAAAWSVPYCQYREVCSPTWPNANKPTINREPTPGPVPRWYL